MKFTNARTEISYENFFTFAVYYKIKIIKINSIVLETACIYIYSNLLVITKHEK